MSYHLPALVTAILLAAAGGEFFMKGVLGTALHLGVPRFLVATTLAAFATSSPELTVSAVAALAGQPEIGLGDALGSNVVNFALVLGLALVFGGLEAEYGTIRREYRLALGIPVLTTLLLLDGFLTRLEGLLLLGLFAIWISMVTIQGYHHRRRASIDTRVPARSWLTLLYLAAGLAMLILAGRLFVYGATGTAHALGVDSYIVGSVLVAIGTSLPELATVLIARYRGHHDVGLGALLGSNLFNGLFIVGVAASIHPIHLPWSETLPALIAGFIAVTLIRPRDGRIPSRRSMPLLSVYLLFLASTWLVGYSFTTRG